MKNKVVVFTQNNARILVNPQQLDVFYTKENALVNPDLSFVDGVAPHHWKLMVKDRIPVADAIRLRNIVSDLLGNQTSHQDISQERVFYHTLLKHINRQIEDSSDACFKVADLLKRASGIDRKVISESITEDLIIDYGDEDLNKENMYYKNMIRKWDQGLIIPMDDEERLARQKHISKYGVDNMINQPKKTDFDFWWSMIILSVFILLWVMRG